MSEPPAAKEIIFLWHRWEWSVHSTSQISSIKYQWFNAANLEVTPQSGLDRANIWAFQWLTDKLVLCNSGELEIPSISKETRERNNTKEKVFWMWILGLFFQFPGALHLLLGKSALYLETTRLNCWKEEKLQGIQKTALNRFSYLVFQGRFRKL